MRTIRWGIIGCGNVTEVKSGPGFQDAANSALVAVMRRNAALAEDYARRHGVPKWYADAQALISDPEVDVVYVATPPASHMEYVLACARAGKPVYVEKPMARNLTECEAMIDACRSAGVPLFVAYYRRTLPRFLKIKELVQSGTIGDVRLVMVTLHQKPALDDADPIKRSWRVVPEIAGGGRFLDLASHTLDFLDYVLGPISQVRGLAGNQASLYPAEDIVTATWKFASGVQGIGVWCFTTYGDLDATEIVGSRGKLAFSIFGAEPICLTTLDGEARFAIENPIHIQQPMIQSVVDEMNGIGRCPSTGVTAARTTWVMDEVLRAWRRRSPTGADQ
jgi:1,5-anhydro-D-fructose reductase (1,5-anhydro-D-mannitol-forming)